MQALCACSRRGRRYSQQFATRAAGARASDSSESAVAAALPSEAAAAVLRRWRRQRSAAVDRWHGLTVEQVDAKRSVDPWSVAYDAYGLR